MRIGLLVTAMLMTACSTMTASEHKYYASSFIGVHKCQDAGYMDATTAGKGRAWINSRATPADAAKIREVGMAIEPSLPAVTQQYCDRLAGDLLGAAGMQQSQPTGGGQTYYTPQLPKQTYCNKIGTQVICSTY